MGYGEYWLVRSNGQNWVELLQLKHRALRIVRGIFLVSSADCRVTMGEKGRWQFTVRLRNGGEGTRWTLRPESAGKSSTAESVEINNRSGSNFRQRSGLKGLELRCVLRLKTWSQCLGGNSWPCLQSSHTVALAWSQSRPRLT